MKFIDNIILTIIGCKDDFSKAECYEFGRTVEKNFDFAMELYLQAMKQEDPRAYFRIAQWYKENNELNKAIKIYYEGAIRNSMPSQQSLEELANRNNFFAAFMLGKFFESKEEWSKAIEWHEKAARGGNTDAMYRLGQIYMGDIAKIKLDLKKAFEWFREAAKNYSKFGLNELAERSASNGMAAFHMAEMYEKGEGGLQSNLSKAIEFYSKAAELKNPQANLTLGKLYESGMSAALQQDIRKAYSYFALAALEEYEESKSYLERLAQTENPEAQYALGYYYYQAKGSIVEAAHWCVKAEMQKHPLALQYLTQTQFNAAVCLQIAHQYELDASNPERNRKMSLEFYSKAAKLGDKNAAFELAQFYQIDHGEIQKDLKRAFDYYMLAAKLGHPEAWIPLERLGEEMSAQKQRELSSLFESCHLIFNNKNKAEYWRNKASEVESFIFKMK